jgi:hypothetical protein
MVLWDLLSNIAIYNYSLIGAVIEVFRAPSVIVSATTSNIIVDEREFCKLNGKYDQLVGY